MKEQFLNYEQAIALKELGFDTSYFFASYLDNVNLIPREEEDGWDLKNGIKAPLKQQAFKFFREKYGLISKINWISALPKHNTFAGLIENTEKEVKLKECETYEEAEEACINKLIEIAKESV
jgi:hypothetical protein